MSPTHSPRRGLRPISPALVIPGALAAVALAVVLGLVVGSASSVRNPTGHQPLPTVQATQLPTPSLSLIAPMTTTTTAQVITRTVTRSAPGPTATVTRSGPPATRTVTRFVAGPTATVTRTVPGPTTTVTAPGPTTTVTAPAPSIP